jgi:methionyl-tRNA formyltransferase
MKALRLVFFGSPAFALPSLVALREAGHDVALVVTQPDRPAGRGLRLAAPPVAQYAREQSLPLWQTSTLKGGEAEQRLHAVSADGMALAAFAALVPRNLLEIAPLGILNVHPSLLPRWRGASPIQAAILAGDPETGATIICLEPAMDAGPIVCQERVPIGPEDDYLTLEPRLATLGGRLLVEALEGLVSGRLMPRPQDNVHATYCRRIERVDARIDWRQSAEAIWRHVRAFRGWPQAFTTWQGRTLKVLRALPLPDSSSSEPGTIIALPRGALGVVAEGGTIRLDEVTLEGRRPQSGADFLRGHPHLLGERLGIA